MAHGQTRARTVLVRLRSMMSRVLGGPVARRLLVVGGIALAGWLLGSAGQAHAETGPDPAADLARAVVNAVPDKADGAGPELGLPARVLPDRTATARPAEQAAHRAARAVGVRRGMVGGFVRDVVAPKRYFGLPYEIEQVMTGVIPTMGGTGTDAPWPSEHRTGSTAGDGARTAVNTVAPGSTSGAAKEARSGPAHLRTGTADPASQPGFPHRAALHTGALSSAGSVLTGGAVGHLARYGAAARPATVLASVVGAIPPAVHTATDEPALSPD